MKFPMLNLSPHKASTTSSALRERKKER